jgi:hypothetical protein
MTIVDTHAPGTFCWFELATTDQSATKEFYSALFNWTAVDYPMGPDDAYTMFKIEGLDVGAAYTMRPDQRAQGVPPNWMVYIASVNADQTAAKIAAAGGTVMAPPFNVNDVGRMAVIQDPTGAMFAIWQPITHIGTRRVDELNTVCWADLSTPDVPCAAKFYGDVFGWQVTAGKDMSPAGPDDYGHIVSGTEFIGGMPPAAMRNPHAPPHWMIYIDVASCEDTTAKAKSLGAGVHMAPMKVAENRWMAVLADPQGAVFALHQKP